MAEQIKIDGDASGVLSEVNKLKRAVEELKKLLGSIEVKVNTDAAQKSLAGLTASAQATRKALAAADGSGGGGGDQAQALDEIKAILADLTQLASSGIALKLDTTQARAEIARLQKELQHGLTAGAAAAGVGAGAGASSGSASASGAGADADNAALNNERRRALREEREERNRQRRTGGAGQPGAGPAAPGAPGAGAAGNNAKPKADDQPKTFFQRLGEQLRKDPQTGRLGRITGAAGGIAGGLMSGNGSGGMMRSIGGGLGTLGGAAIGTLIGGPLGAVVGGLAGSLLGSIGGSAGGKMDEAIGDVIAEGLDLSNLQRSVGGTNTSFGELQHRLREASAGLQTTFGEMAKYGQAFARQANFRGDASELAEEVKNAVGYARGFGADPQAGLQFMATMRHTQASKSDQDSRKIGLSVAEAIGRGGLGPKTDEVLTAIGNFANQAANSALTAPDVSSFASALGTASATGIAGLAGNPGNAAAILGQADAAMRQGGAFGQASSVLTDIALRKQGMNFGDVNLLKEQGLFGTEKDAFGADSAVQKSLKAKLADTTGNVSDAEKAQLRAELSRYEGLAANSDGRTNADKVMGRLREMSANQTEYREALKSHFGLKTASQAEAFDTVIRTHGGTGALSKRLEQAGVDTKNLNALSIGGMSEVFGADRSGLQRMGNDILKDKEFSSKNRDLAEKLRAAMGGKDTEALRDALFLAKEKGAGNMTDVERANQAAIDLKNEFMKFADAMLPLVTAAKDGILALVQKLAPDTKFGKQLAEEERIRELAASDSPEDRKRAERQAARMAAQGHRPATEEVAKLAAAGADDQYGRLDKRASELEADAKDIRENGWFFPETRARSKEARAQRAREAQQNLRGNARTTEGSGIPVPEGATAPATMGDAAPKVGGAAPKLGGASAAPAATGAITRGATRGENLENRALLERAATDAGITDPRERAQFMAQMSHESGGFQRLLEGASGEAYEGRRSLGNTEAGDGKRFKGRGFIQLTGRYNYKKYGDMVGEDLVGNPDRAADPDVAAKIATAYWKDRGVGDAAKRGDTEAVTKLINGGHNGLADRRRRTQAEYALAGLDANGKPAPTAVAAAKPAPAVAAAPVPAVPPTPAPTAVAAAKPAPAPPRLSFRDIGDGQYSVTDSVTGVTELATQEQVRAMQLERERNRERTREYREAFARANSPDTYGFASAGAPQPDAMTQPIPSGGKDGPGVSAAAGPGGQQAVKVTTEIIVRDQNGKERDDVQAKPMSYESLPAGVPA